MLDLESSLAVALGIHTDGASGPRRRRRHIAPWGWRMEARHLARYDPAHQHAARHSAAWNLVEDRRARHVAAWALDAFHRHAVRHLASWYLLSGEVLIPVVNSPELAHAGRTLRIEAADLSSDEDSAVWLARITLAREADYAGIEVGDPIELSFGGLETFRLVVDGKLAQREPVASMRLELSAISPLALKGAPWAQPVTLAADGAIGARALVEAQIGPTDWRLPDWIIPAGRAIFTDSTPLAIARAVVESVGGLVESAPDGTPVCRRRHPVPVPDYASATPEHRLSDRDLLGVGVKIASRPLYDRVAVSNDLEVGARDRLEYTPDEDDRRRGTMWAWPNPARPVLLAHTGLPDVVIIAEGERSRTVTELVEFVEGQGRVSYPVSEISAMEWLRADLGAISAYSSVLKAAVAGYSLLRVTYVSRALAWRVQGGADDTVQFVLMPAD